MYKRRPKYYVIKAEVVWGVIAGMIALLVIVSLGSRMLTDQGKTGAVQEERRETVNVTFKGLTSKLDDAGQCCLCGHNERSLMGYYRKFDTIGLISLNDWYVLDFPLKNYDGEGNEIAGDASDHTTSGNTGEIAYSRRGTISRGMAKIDVTLPEDYKLDTDALQKNLCQKCLDKVADSLEYWKWEDEEKEAIPLCLVDFETADIYPVQNRYVGYFIRDYWIEMDFDEDEVEIGAFYLPER